MKVSAQHHNKITHIETQRLLLRLAHPTEAAKVVRYLVENREHLANSGPAYPQDYFNQSFWEERLAQNIADARDDKSLRMFMYEKNTNATNISVTTRRMSADAQQNVDADENVAANKHIHTNERIDVSGGADANEYSNSKISLWLSDNEHQIASGSDIIGGINLNEIVRRAAQFCYLGYGLDKHHQGRELMTEAVQAIVKHAFEGMNIHRIMANYMPDNKRSGALLERLGFTVKGVARDYLHINGEWQDHVLTSLTNPEWKPNLT